MKHIRKSTIIIRKIHEQEYLEALPILKNAQEAVMKIDKSQLNIIKSYNNPPFLVVLVLQAVCLLFGYEENWENAKQYLLNDIKFIDKLINFQVVNLPDNIFVKLKNNYLSRPDFKKELVIKQSSVAGSIFDWLLNINVYQQISKIIIPKQKKLEELLIQLKKLEKNLKEKDDFLTQCNQSLENLQLQLKESEQNQELLKQKLDMTQLQLNRAEKTLNGLAEESVRWMEMEAFLFEKLNKVTGNMLVGSGMIAYLGSMQLQFRNQLCKKWHLMILEKNLPISNNFNFIEILTDQSILADWKQNGLPQDILSIQNAIIYKNSRKKPLFIDPQSQCKRWLMNQHISKNFKIVKQNDPRFFKILENSMQYGQAFFMEILEKGIDSILEPVIIMAKYKKGQQFFIKIGENEVLYHPEFIFIMASKQQNPQFNSELITKVTIINFSITQEGLIEQLLINVVLNEKPHLEEQIYLLEKEEDDSLNMTLEKVQHTQTDISNRTENSKITFNNIQKIAETYRSVAIRGCIIFMAIQNLQELNPMYEWSLEYYLNIFQYQLKTLNYSSDIAQRIEILIKGITHNIFQNICRGLFTKDRLIFATIICNIIQIQNKELNSDQFQFILESPKTQIQVSQEVQNQIPNKIYLPLLQLCTADQEFMPFLLKYEQYQDFIQAYVTSDEPCLLELPFSMTPFKKLIMAKYLREDRVYFEIQNYIKSILGNEILIFDHLDLKQVYDDSCNNQPIIFILNPGLDPIEFFLSFSLEKRIFRGNVQVISLGKGQGDKAKEVIYKAQKNGDWVYLQNCHLAISWFDQLEQILDQTQDFSIDKNFRIWLTSMPCKQFPRPILQKGIKITNEGAQNIKAQMKKIYEKIQIQDYSNFDNKTRQLIFSITLFHSVVQERKNFGAIGWQKTYYWLQSDFDISVLIIQVNQLNQDHVNNNLICNKNNFNCSVQEILDFRAINYLISQIVYGGRISDSNDNLLIESILQDFLNPKIYQQYQYTESPQYKAPENFSLDNIFKQIEQFPQQDDTYIFGLHHNCRIIQGLSQSQQFIQDLNILNKKKSLSDLKDKIDEQFILDIQMQINQIPNIQENKIKDKLDSLETFRSQELQKYSMLLNFVQQTLKQAQLASQGIVGMDDGIENLIDSLINNEVPDQWNKYSFYHNKKLAQWINDLKFKIDYLKTWVFREKMSFYYLSLFFFPQGFFIAIKQLEARSQKVPLDQLDLKVQLSSQNIKTNKQLKKTYLIKGIQLQGCSIELDNEDAQIIEQVDQQIIYEVNTFMQIELLSIQVVIFDQQETNNTYMCPVYKHFSKQNSQILDNNNFIAYLRIPCTLNQKHWLKRGASIIIQKLD